MKVPEETDVVWMESTRTERRSRRRFAIQQPLSVEVLNANRRPIVGVTVNISSNGIQFVAAKEIPIGAAIRVVLAWPVPSNAQVELALLARVVRSEGCLIAAQVWSHQFQSLPASAA
jgi:c-di-GMP-binding flagellar brake protein YcgR